MPEADPLARLLKPTRRTAVIDVGANPHDGGRPVYAPLLQRGLCHVIGFEPHAKALAALRAKKRPSETYLPYALGDGKEQTFYVCRLSGMSSLLRPDETMLRQFPAFSEWGEVASEQRVSTKRLDDVAEIQEADFIKLDIQGAELMVLRNAPRILRQCVCVQLEVAFITQYEDQPTFADIDIEMRQHGYLPHMFQTVMRRVIAPMYVPNSPQAGLNQLLQADIVYVKSFVDMTSLSNEQLKQLAMVAHHCYRSFDLGYRCVHELIMRGELEQNTAHDYLKLMK